MPGRISWLGHAVGVYALGAAVVCAGLASTASADSFGSGANQFDIDFVTIDGSTNPTGGYDIVNNDYRIGVYEITNGQWNKFKAELGVPVTGDPSNAYYEDPYWTGTNVPTNEVSWYEAAQFVNWLNTSEGHQAAYKFTGTQGQSDYALATWSAGDADGTNLYRHKDAFYYLPTEDEWVKAGYWNGTGFQTWATPDDTQPVEDVEANYGWESGAQPWDVGSGSEELNGTFDIMGNVYEWMESPYASGDYGVGSFRGLRGGDYSFSDYYLASSSGGHYFRPYTGDCNIGFRVASEVPEPFTFGLLSLGGLALLARRRR